MLRNLGRTSWVSKNIGMFFGNNTKIQGCVRENGEWMRERERETERDWEIDLNFCFQLLKENGKCGWNLIFLLLYYRVML